MYDYLNGRLPETFDGTWRMRWEMNNNDYELRNMFDLNIPFTRYVYIDKHPLFNTLRLWNDLPEHLKLIGSRNMFATQLKRHLMQDVYFL